LKSESAEGECDLAATTRFARRGVIRGFLSKNAQTAICQVRFRNFRPFTDDEKKCNKTGTFPTFRLTRDSRQNRRYCFVNPTSAYLQRFWEVHVAPTER
jgi:hypothetical protein